MPTSTVLIHRLWASWLWSQVAVEYRSGLNQHYILISRKWFKDEYMIQVKTTKTCKAPCQDFSLHLKHRVSSVLDLMLWGCTTGAVQNKTKKTESRVTSSWDLITAATQSRSNCECFRYEAKKFLFA